MASMAPAEDNTVTTTGDAITCDSSGTHNQTDLTSSEGQVPNRSIENVLGEAMVEGDLMWSLFVSAAKSYRFSSVLHPFPPMYSAEDGAEKHLYALREAVSQVPKFSSLPDFLSRLSPDCHNLLSWVFQKPKFQLKLQDKEECFTHILTLTGQIMDAPKPTYIFEVLHDVQEEDKFRARQGSRKNFYAFHGSRFDNFYSILHNGLNVHLNKVSVFGEGTYLSSELSVSLLYSQAGEAWAKSCLGARLACVAVCEMIDEPSVKCQIKDGSASVQKQRAQASKITDAVPEKYYVVQNNDAVRVKYLLVYKDANAPSVPQGDSPSYSWLREHKFPLLMLAYVILLLAIGLANSRHASKAFTRFWNQFMSS